jgi:hypothetical protein
MKTLEVWQDWNGNVVFSRPLEDIQSLDISDETLSITLKDYFSNEFSLVNDGMHYSFKIV